MNNYLLHVNNNTELCIKTNCFQNQVVVERTRIKSMIGFLLVGDSR